MQRKPIPFGKTDLDDELQIGGGLTSQKHNLLVQFAELCMKVLVDL